MTLKEDILDQPQNSCITQNGLLMVLLSSHLVRGERNMSCQDELAGEFYWQHY